LEFSLDNSLKGVLINFENIDIVNVSFDRNMKGMEQERLSIRLHVSSEVTLSMEQEQLSIRLHV